MDRAVEINQHPIINRFFQGGAPNSYDRKSRLGSAVVASDAVVEGVRIDFDAFFARGLPNTLPLQTDHDHRLAEKRGQWTGFKIEVRNDASKLLAAQFQLSRRPDNEALHTLLTEGLVSGVSIGFQVTRWKTETDEATGQQVRVALEGRMLEASFVNNPADPRTTVRSQTLMDNETTNEVTTELPQNDSTVERLSPERFDSMMRMTGVDDELRTTLVQSDLPDHQRVEIALRSLEQNSTPVTTHFTGAVTTLDNPTVLRSSVIEFFDAINRGEEPVGAAREVFANGERGLAERICRQNNIQTMGLSDREVFRRAATTSDFPIIADGTFNLAMRRELESSAAPIAALFGMDTVSSFNAETRALADWTSLAIDDRLESGHYKHSFIHETGETVSVAMLGGITSKSYELSINAGSRLGNDGVQFGRRLAAEVADRQVAFIEQASAAGPKMSDNKSVFHADRGNIETFTQSAETMIAQLMGFRSKMAKRKGAGNVQIGNFPTHWMVHSDYEETALRLLSQVQASAVADVNPLAGKLQVVVEPRLTDPEISWLAVQPSQMDGAVRVFLQGQEAPFTDSRINFETDALQFKIRHPFGLGWLEWRSWTRLDHTSV